MLKFSSRVLLACVFCVSTVCADTFLESGGIVIFEAESSGPEGDWELESSIGGFSGSGYLRWDGPDGFAVSTAGRGETTYRFRIERAGNYELLWRSRITRGNNRTEHNDSWARFPTGSNIPGEQGLNGWTKVYMSTLNQWKWQSATVDNVGRRVRQFFSAGEHTFQISGRSNGHAIDRIALFDYSDNRINPANFDSLPQSNTVGNTPPPTPPAADPVVAEPEPEILPEPQPAPDPVPAPTPTVNTQAPSATVSGSTLMWEAVDAIAINVHRGTGEWLESLPGSATQWQASESGEYYLVATGSGSWESWGRSDTVTVTTNTNSNENSSALQLTAQVYSSSALELFWVNPDAVSLNYEVRRNDELLSITDGQSYFDDSLDAGTQYIYRVVAFDAEGNEVTSGDISASTLGNSGENMTGSAGSISLTAQAYSQSAIELFWNTSQLDANSTYRFEVHLNGQILGTTDGRSYFTENLNADTDYEFFVTTLNSGGAAVGTESTLIRTFPADIDNQ